MGMEGPPGPAGRGGPSSGHGGRPFAAVRIGTNVRDEQGMKPFAELEREYVERCLAGCVQLCGRAMPRGAFARSGRPVGEAVAASEAYWKAAENRRRYEKGRRTSFAELGFGSGLGLAGQPADTPPQPFAPAVAQVFQAQRTAADPAAHFAVPAHPALLTLHVALDALQLVRPTG